MSGRVVVLGLGKMISDHFINMIRLSCESIKMLTSGLQFIKWVMVNLRPHIPNE